MQPYVRFKMTKKYSNMNNSNVQKQQGLQSNSKDSNDP